MEVGAGFPGPLLAVALLLAACGEQGASPSLDGEGPGDGGGPDQRTPLVALTFNTGTSERMGHDQPPDDGYTSSHAKTSDLYYGDGLAWTRAVDATRAWLARVRPDVVAFQEVFYSEECASIPAAAKKDFICETWNKGDPTVARLVLGAGYQVACHKGKPDKCAAVKKSLGTFAGCAGDFCLEGLDGYPIEGCGKGSRIGRGVINLVGGGTITLVSVHASSGIDSATIQCRQKQFDQIFDDLGDGKPAASGTRNLIMGDFNTDPGRLAQLDASAARINTYVGAGKKFHFVSPVGLQARPTYAGLLNIDHVISDRFEGSCWSAGVTAGKPPVIQATYFDHKPLVCTIKVP
jgi:endonuclease/exonuclease/phosphatase family metal-dependent hydrolase